jgi:hypothetical protein
VIQSGERIEWNRLIGAIEFQIDLTDTPNVVRDICRRAADDVPYLTPGVTFEQTAQDALLYGRQACLEFGQVHIAMWIQIGGRIQLQIGEGQVLPTALPWNPECASVPVSGDAAPVIRR